MPDKRTDEQLINQAWEHMLATLDQEMPVETKRRRVIMVPWRLAAAASVLLLLTLGAGWWLAQRSPNQTLVDSTPTAPTEQAQTGTKVEDAANVATDHTKEEALVQKDQQQEMAENQVIEAPIVSSDKALKTPVIAKKQSSYSNKKQVIAPVQALQQIANLKKEAAGTQELIKTSENTVATAIAQTETVTPPAAQKQSLQALNAQQIALLENEPLKLEEKKKVEFFGETQAEKDAKSSKWNIGLELATYASAGAAVDGYAGGAVVAIPMQSEKFNLRTGLNFNAQQRYFDSNVPISEADRGANPSFGTSTVVVDPDPDFQVNAQQLSFPLTLEFKPRKSWGLEGGLQASYLLGARNLKGAEAYQTLAGFTNGNESIRTFVTSLSKQAYDVTSNADPIDNSTVNLNAFRRMDVALTAGFGYYPTNNIGVRLQYQRGLIDMLKADQFTTFGNNVRLSAVYFFK